MRPVPWFRILLGAFGIALLVMIVRHVGFDVVITTLRPALPWVSVLCVLELFRICCATIGSYLAFGPIAKKIPRALLFRAHVLGHSIGQVAPAPTVFNETIKATLITPYTGVGPAAAVGFTNQAATFMANGLFTFPCALAIFALQGPSIWFWACLTNTVVLVASGIALQAGTRSEGLNRFLARRLPKLAARAEAFRDHARGIRIGARGPTEMLLLGRFFQMMQYGVAGYAVGIQPSALRVLASEGVHLVSMAVGVLVPGGFGMTEGAFTLAATLLETTVAKATSLALLMRCMQLIWVAIASVIAIVTRGPIAPPQK